VEHTAGYSFAHNRAYFDPENIVKLAIEAECSAVASTLGVLGLVSGKYAAKIPFIVKLNHNERLTYPLDYDQVMFASVQQAHQMGAAGVGATIFFGSPHSRRQIVEVSQAFHQAHQLGMFTMLWAYPRNKNWRKEQTNYETSADITGQANYLGVTLEADIIKQKLPTLERAFDKLDFSKYSSEMYQNLLSPHPIDLLRYQVINCFAGKISLLNSGGGSQGQDDLYQAIAVAVINKRGGGSGMIMGRKVFNRPFDKGVALIKAVQDVYLDPEIDLA
jgi:class I fructose-bisphosphate aldolase